MSIEEKAKAYDEALERARKYMAKGYDVLMPEIFPELRESEDERIRKALIDFFDSALGKDLLQRKCGQNPDTVLAYLEKQKYNRMKPIYDARESFESALEKAWNDYHNGYENVDKLEDDYMKCAHAKGFREGYLFGLGKQKEHSMSAEEVLAKAGLKPYKDGNQWCIFAGDNIQEGICGFGDTIDEALYQFLMEVLEIQKKRSLRDFIDDFPYSDQKEQKYIPKFKVGDRLVSTKNTHLTYKILEVGHVNELGNIEYKVEIFTDGKSDNPSNIKYIECSKVDEWGKLIEPNPAWSEKDIDKMVYERARKSGTTTTEMFFYRQGIKDTLKSLRSQPKQEWSKEDEAHRNFILESLEDQIRFCKKDAEGAHYAKQIRTAQNWLKAFKPSWKPSDHQMTVLKAVKEYVGRGSGYWGEALGSLIEDLEKL